MDKENLKVKVEALRANEVIANDALSEAKTKRLRAEVELANAGKPVISCDLAGDIMDEIEEMFSETLNNVCPEDLSPEFGLSYNEIHLECIDTSNIGLCRHDLQAVLEGFFAIQDDEDDFVNEDDSGKVDGKFA